MRIIASWRERSTPIHVRQLISPIQRSESGKSGTHEMASRFRIRRGISCVGSRRNETSRARMTTCASAEGGGAPQGRVRVEPQDDRECDDDEATGKRSLFCALQKACSTCWGCTTIGEWRCRKPGRCRRCYAGQDFEHRLRDLNNLPTTRPADIRKVLQCGHRPGEVALEDQIAAAQQQLEPTAHSNERAAAEFRR